MSEQEKNEAQKDEAHEPEDLEVSQAESADVKGGATTSHGTGGGGGAGKVQMQDFHFVARSDKASP